MSNEILELLVRLSILAALWGLIPPGCVGISGLYSEGEMARATVLKTTHRFPLETVPAVGDEEAGWIELRRLSYGEKIDKDAEAMKMRMAMGGKAETPEMEIALVSAVATQLEFSRCITDHNLTDDEGKPLDFKKPEDVRKLDPRVGSEINTLIGELNDYEREAKTSILDAAGK